MLGKLRERLQRGEKGFTVIEMLLVLMVLVLLVGVAGYFGYDQVTGTIQPGISGSKGIGNITGYNCPTPSTCTD